MHGEFAPPGGEKNIAENARKRILVTVASGGVGV